MTIDLPMAAIMAVPAALATWWLGLRTVETRASRAPATLVLGRQTELARQIAGAYEQSPHTVGPLMAQLAHLDTHLLHVHATGGRPSKQELAQRDALVRQLLEQAVPERERVEAGR